MPYTINKTDGTTLTTLADGTTNTTYAVTFVGKNYANYGAEFNENFLHLMENFSNSSAPNPAIEGQLWWDNVLKSLKVYYSGVWRAIPVGIQMTGTANQITVTNTSGSAVSFSLPQNIHSAASPTFSSLTLTTSSAPLTVTGTALVTNLNADLLDNQQGTYYLDYDNFSNKPNLGTISSQDSNNVAITGGTITGLTSALPIESGGTGGITAEQARTSLGLTALASADLPLAVNNGGTGGSNASAARAGLGLGTLSTQNAGSASISGGTVTGLTNFSVISGTPTVPTAAVATDSTQIASTAFVHDILPAGVILMWSGSVASIPTGWALCNGTNSTPDLRNRFIVGAGDSYAVGATGGSKDAVVVSHSHTGTTGIQSADHTHTATSTVVDPGHSHPIDYISQLRGVGGGSDISGTGGVDSTNTATTGITVATTLTVQSADHTHSFTTAAQGVSGTDANLPPYYALCYIMKVTG